MLALRRPDAKFAAIDRREQRFGVAAVPAAAGTGLHGFPFAQQRFGVAAVPAAAAGIHDAGGATPAAGSDPPPRASAMRRAARAAPRRRPVSPG